MTNCNSANISALRKLRATTLGFLLLGVFVGPGCKQKPDYSVEISKIDSTVVFLSEVLLKINDLDSVALVNSGLTLAVSIKQIEDSISNDTISKNFANQLESALHLQNEVHALLNNKENLTKALLASKEQLLNLKHDLQNNLIPQNNSRDFVVNEIQSAEKIASTAQNTLDKNKDAVGKLNVMENQLQHAMTSLTEK